MTYFTSGWGVLPHKRLMEMCQWMMSHFHDWIDYHGVAFSLEILERGHTFSNFGHRCTGTFGLGGAVTLLPEKITQCPKECVVQTHSNRHKTKTLPILTSNERIIIPKLQFNPNFSNLRWKRKLVRKIGYFDKSGVTKITVSDEGEGNDFCFELSGGSKK